MKRSIALLLALLCLLGTVGCGQQTAPAEEKVWIGNGEENLLFDPALSYAGEGAVELFHGALNPGAIAISAEQHMPIYRFDTLAELEQFRADYAELVTMEQGYDEVPSFAETVQNYDDAFFADNSLLLVHVWANSGSQRFGIREVTTENGRLCIRVEQTNDPAEGTDDLAGWFLTAAIARSTAAQYTAFDAVLER